MTIDAAQPAVEHGESLKKFRARSVNRTKFVWLAVLALVGLGILWFSLTAASALGRITSSSSTKSPVLKFIGEALDPNALNGEGDGRINILLIGIGGSGHKGGPPADTHIVGGGGPPK